MEKRFYVDSCIYLNLWQEEVNKKRDIAYWKFAKDFFEKYDKESDVFYYSGFILKELRFILTKEEYAQKRILFYKSPNFKRIKISPEEYAKARKIESDLKYQIGFFDIIHMLLAMKTQSVLVTRDRELLRAAKKYKIVAKKPEQLL